MSTTITVIIVLVGGDHDEQIGATIASLATNTTPTEVVTVAVVGDDWLGSAINGSDNDYFMVLFPGDRCRPGAIDALCAELRRPGEHEGDVAAMAYADHVLASCETGLDVELSATTAGGDPSDDATIVAVAELPSEVVYKPTPSPDFLLGKNYVANAAIFDRRHLGDDPFATNPVEAMHDLTLRGMRRGARSLASIMFQLVGPPAALSPSVDAVRNHLERLGVGADVVDGHADTVQVRYTPIRNPLVSIIIPTRGSSGRVWGINRAFVVDAVSSVALNSDYNNVEFVIVYDHDTPPSVLHALDRLNASTKLIHYSKPFNFSDKINVGAAHAEGDLLLLLNDDTELIAADSIATMVALSDRPGTGIVGARLLYADGTLQHGGHTYSGQMLHSCVGWPGDSPGPRPLTPLAVTREVSGVTAAAAMVAHSVFDEVGGFDIELPVNFNDVDFCLKVLSSDRRNLWTPTALWYHFETVTRSGVVDQAELDLIMQRWGTRILDDPFYNPNLARKHADWRVVGGR